MKSGSGKRNLLLAAMMVSMCTTTLVAQADPSSIYEAVSDTGCGTYTLNIDDVPLTQSLGKPAGQNRALIINGNGLDLDGNNQFSGFETPGNYLILTNLTSMKNFYKTSETADVYGGAIYNSTALNYITSGETQGPVSLAVNFINNQVYSESKDVYGGAIAIKGSGAKTGNITGDFVSNKASVKDSAYKSVYGGAIFNNNSVIESITSAADGQGFYQNSVEGLNSTVKGGAIFNYEQIKKIKSVFRENKAVSSNQAYGGAIFNQYKIGQIEADFYDNSAGEAGGVSSSRGKGGAIANDYYTSEPIIGDYNSSTGTFADTYAIKGNFVRNSAGQGGAIYNKTGGKIGNIEGNFEDNFAYNYGGAVYNESNKSYIGTVTGNFTGNKAGGESDSTLSAYGGAVYNVNNAKINGIKGNFEENGINIKYGNSDGGAIYNYQAEIGDITGNFINNYVYTASYSGDSNGKNARGGAIFNGTSSSYTPAKIGAIKGDFTENSAESGESGYIMGGAVYNGPSAEITSITASDKGFTGNYAKYAEGGTNAYSAGGAVANIFSNSGAGKIGDITADFTGNYAASSSRGAAGGAVFNGQNYSVSDTAAVNLNAQIGNITGDFKDNYAQAGKSTSLYVYGGAIFNGGTIGNITASKDGFVNNSVSFGGNYSTNVSKGGAIFNAGTMGDIKADFINNKAESNGFSYSGGYGGAIYNAGTLGAIIDSSFIGNTAQTSGGAIYNDSHANGLNITAQSKDVEFSGNRTINSYGAAIYDISSEGTTLNAAGGNIIFKNNNYTGTAGGSGVGIQTSNLTLSSSDSHYISLSDRMNISGLTSLNGGTVKLSGDALSNKFNSVKVNENSAIDLSNNGSAADNMKIGTLDNDYVNAPAKSTLTLNVDYDGTADSNGYGSMDKLTVDTAYNEYVMVGDSLHKRNVKLDLNNINILTDGEATKAIFLDGDGAGSVTILNSDVAKEIASSGGYTYTFTHDTATKGLLNISRVEHQYDLPKLIADSTLGINQYSITTNDYKPFQIAKEGSDPAEYYSALGTLDGVSREFTISGGSATSMHSIDGTTMASAKGDGVTVGSGRTLNLRNISQFKNFTTAVDNAGILNVEGVTFTSNTTDVNNTATLNLSGTNIINTITDAETPVGTTNITDGNTVLWTDGSITQNTINLKGGNLLLNPNSTLTANIVADGSIDKTGYLNSSANINGTISGTFKGNNTAVALRNSGTIGVITADFVNNINIGYWGPGAIYNEGTIDSISGNFTGNSKTSEATYVEGGAIYNSGTITNGITNSTFTGNSATSSSDNAYGGAIYQSGGTLNITGSTFGGSEEGQGNSATSTASGKNGYGGAIYLNGGTATINSSTFDSNYVKGSSGGSGGAIYSNGTALTITGTAENPTVFKNNGISKYENSTGSASGGAIYQKNGTLNISNAKFENNVSSFNTKQYLYGGAIYSEATGGNISADFTGNILSAVAVQGSDNGGGAIYNRGTLTKITGIFTNNAINLQPISNNEQSGESLGGALYNRGTITDGLEGTFSGNTITTNVKQSDANGGAIANGGTIGNITGDFLNNYVTSTNTTYSGSARGGAIYNLSGTIGNITATNATENGFKGNSATKAAGYNAEGLGGAIYNYNGTIGNITANFVNNTATNYGGAIYNIAEDNYKSEIGNIIGNFTGNTASQGSAIYNKVKNDESYINNKLAKIGDITGNFTENAGTVIYNEGYYDFNNFNEIVYAQIGDITGNFAENSASSGNVIFNNYGKIGDITGDFTENTTNNGVINNRGSIDSITANTTTHKGFYKNTGGAVRNESSADYHRNATIGNITADFKENSAVSSGGGAIYNTGSNASAKAKIGDITGDFDKNTSKNYGGAIYNNYSIIGAQNNLGEFTGTAITGDFTNNQVTNNSVYDPTGGAISNERSSAIGDIQGNFENNSIINSRYKAMGGAIANRNSSTIGNITGNFNTNTISYNPDFDTDTDFAQHYGNSSLGGAIYNDSTSTIGTLTGDFVGNWAKGHVAEDDTTTVFAAAGGAIYNEGALGTITGDIKNNYALGHSHHGVYGGAIYTTTGLNLVDSDITGNYVTTQSASATDLKGGAIYTTDGINITASTKNISVSGNKGTEQGAAIYNTSENNAVVLNATGGNITFENNNLTGLANGGGVGIYSAGGLTLNAADGKYISLNDALNITGNTTLNGTLKLGDNAVETLANTTSKFIAQGGTLDIANGAIDTMTFANAVDIQNAMNLGIDVNLTGTTATADKITADFTTGNTSAITLSALNFINDNYTGSEEDHNLTIADGTIKSLINQNITSTTGNTNTYTYSYDNTTGILTVSLVTYDNIYDAVHDTEKTTRTYKIKLAEGETITQALGALAGTKLTVNGNNKYLDGKVGGVKQGGFIVANGQTLELKNISQVKNFTTAVDNAGTLNVENVEFAYNSIADINNTGTATIKNSDVAKIVNSSTVNVTDSTIRNIKNTGVLNISDTDGTPVYMLLITDNETPEGITNITGGYTQFVGNVTQNTINLKGGNLTLPNNTTVNANIVADGTVDKTGYLNNFSSGSTINGTISGTFKGNDEVALSNVGTIGNVTSNFVNNTHSGSSDIMGGAIYNTGTMGTISGNFTGNSATSSSGNAYGGAIYQNGGTLTISGSTFGGSETGQGNSATSSASGKYGYGGAIYLTNATATITDSNFEKNSAMWGGAIYQNSGSLTLNNATFKNNTGNIGSSIYQKSGTLSITGSTFDNTNSGNLWQESGNLSITGSNFTNTDVTSRLGSNVTITGSTFDNSPVHFLGKGNETSASYQNTFSIVNSTIQNVTASHSNAYALSVCGGDVTIDGVNIINNTNAKGIKSEAAAQSAGDYTHYSKLNIIAQTADVNITGNKEGVHVIGWDNDNHFHTTLSLYAKNHDILISGNTDRGLSYYDQYGSLTLNADTGHNITIDDSVSSNVGMTVNGNYGTDAENTNLGKGTVALNGELTLGGATNIQGGTLKLGTDAAGSTFKNVSFTNTPTLDLQNTTADTMVVDKITGDATLNIDVNSTTSVSDAIQIATTGSSGTLTVNSLNFLDDVTTPESFNINVITKGTEGNISGITLAISDELAEEYSGTPTATDYDKPYTYNSNITFDTTKFTTEKWTKTTQKQLTVVGNETAKGLKLDVDVISDVHKADGAYDTHYDALQVLNQHEGTRTLTADGATATTYTVGDNLGTTAVGTLNVTGKSGGSNLDMNSKTGFVVSNADTTLNLTNLNITNINDTQDGGLINLTGAGSKANLENVTIASTTNSAISNAVELNLNGTNNLGTGITGTGTTNINGGKTTIGSITQNAVNIIAGELEVADITAAINNGGILTLKGNNENTINNYTDSESVVHAGSTVIAESLTNTGAINQAITVNGSKTLTTAANLIGGTVTNGGKVELTGGALDQTITGGDITIASGEVTSTVANLGGTITNNSNLLLSGTLDKAIAGTSGITKIDSNLKMTSTGSIEGTLALNGCNLDLSGDGVATQYTVNTLDESGHLKIDIDYSGATPIADSIYIATTGGAGSVQLIDITEIGTAPGSFTVEVLKGDIGLKTLEISDSLAERYRGVEETTITYESDDYSANINFDKTTFDTREYTEKTQKTLSVVDNTKLKLDKVVTETKHQTGVVSKDALAFINQNTDTSAVAERSMVTSDTNKTYTVQEDLGTTGAGTLLVQGASDKTTKLNMNNHSGFVISNSGTTVTLKDINVDNVQNTEGGLVNITNTGSSATLDGVTVNVKDNPENKANVISSNGSVTVKDSTVNAGINNTGTLNFEGTSKADKVSGSTGTTNVKGQTTLGSLVQKLVNIVTGGKLIANGDVTTGTSTGEGVNNAVENGLELNNGTLTGNVNGAGSVKTTGNSAIADGSKVGQAITVDGKLTTLADGLGGAVTNNSESSEVDLTGGTLETSITGGNTTISGNVGVDDTNGLIASDVKVETDAKLTTNADKVTGAINNGGDLDLTGGDIKNAISGDGTTTISGTVTNSTGKNIGNAITVASTGNLTTAADKLGGAVENNGTTNGLTLTGGQLSQNVTGTGKTVIAGTDVSVKYGNSIAQDMVITSGNKLVNTNVTAIGGNVENNGDIQLYSQDNGKLEHNITGSGTTELNRDITVAANIDNTINIKSYTDGTGTHNANVTVESGNNLGKAGQNITVDSNNSLTMQSASDIKGNLVDNGTVELQGGTISNAISGTGNINITGNVINNATNTTTGDVTVAAGKELAIGTNNDVFSSANSVTMGNGSTLNLQNGSPVATNINNVVVGADDTVNIALDWGDQINTTNPSNIAGDLQVSSVDLTGTDGSKQTYQITTTDSLKDKISVKDPLDIQGTGVSNFVKYNDRPASANYGQLTTYQNSLFMAVTDTEVGEIATYNMITDETAGGGELDGTLKVQGNGHSITTDGVVIGSTTIQNAELTLEDANMRNITGDAITVYGGNKGHIVANAHDVAITANTGNAIKLIANGTNYAEMDIDAGSKTVTIDNDIVSDDSNNKVTFKGGTINFNGKFDPAMGVVGGATVNRGGDDDGIDWTVTSGTLNYLQDSYLNRATNTMNLNGGTLNTVNGVVTDFALGGFTLSNDSNFYADVDLAAGKMDNFISTPTTYTGGTLHVAGLNLISDATADNTSIPFANSTLAGHVDYTGAQGLTALSPIYKYNVGYNSSNGNFDFARYNSGGYDGLNPAIMAAPVAAQMGGYLTQLNSYDEAFRNMDMYMLMTASQRQALKNKNKIASLDGGVLYDQTLMRQERAEGWFRPFATFEKVGLRNGPKVENIAYGSYMGGESQMYDLGHGWDGMWGAYVGYNGSHQNYDGVSIYQNGGTLGVLGMAYKGNFFTGLTINAGASGVEASTMYGNEDFAMLMAGIASKTGYNWELFNGKFIIQPSMLMSYSFVNTFDYRNAAGVKVDSDPLHAIQLQPEIKFIGNLKNGWQPYASVAMVWNIMDDTKFKANDVSLPELSVKPYVKYGVGVRKTWGERLTGFFQTYLTNGGRNGVGLQAGFTWAFGGGKDKKADEKKIQKSLNKTPELKKTEIVLNGKKVQ